VVIYRGCPKGASLVVESMFSFWKKIWNIWNRMFVGTCCFGDKIMVLSVKCWSDIEEIIVAMHPRKWSLRISPPYQGGGQTIPQYLDFLAPEHPFGFRMLKKYTFWFQDVPQKIGQNANVRLQNWCTEVVMMDRRTTTSCTFLTSTPWNGDNPKHLASAKIL
jgi:hypothetical protein